jgi:hypothetical protein
MQPAEELNENNHLLSEVETGVSMTHTAIPCYWKPSDRLRKRRSLTVFLILVMACGTGAFAEDVSQPNNPPSSLPATHLLGFAGARNNSKGTLSIEGDALQFKKNGKAAVQVKIASIHDLLLGDLSRQVGGVPVTLAKAAVPFSGGRALSLFTHKKYDTLTLEYVDAEGGLHGAIFELKKGQAEGLRNELLAQGASVSNAGNEPTKQTAEASSENR